MNIGPLNSNRLDDLHEPPKVSYSLSSIPVPPPARFRLKQQLQGLAIGPGVAFPEAVEDGRECLLRRGFDVYVLLNVERQVFQCHCSFSWYSVSDSS
jgi:hypothetical protein